jgi:hypothetical protein
MLTPWVGRLRSGGWVALTEVDRFFDHEPLGVGTRALFETYAAEALAAGRYDFSMGHKLADFLSQLGFTVTKFFTVTDRELSFEGPADPEVLDAWRTRLDGMSLLKTHCGAEFDRVRGDFLECLSRDDHQALARVYFCLATL